ncbi:hypothetical protein T08_247 [Trichinella sp. T8]|nr:hypothetical protein T08_247 [Trichinella sp. T8]
MTDGHRAVILWQEYVDVILSKLSTPPLACFPFRPNLVVIVHGRYDTMVQSSEKANVEEFNFLPCSWSNSLGSSGFYTPSEYAVKKLSHVTL